MTEIPNTEGSKYPTLMRDFETDEDLDEYVIDHAYMFVVIQIRPGGYVNGYGSNYTRTEVTFEEGDDRREALATAIKVAEELHKKTGKSLLVYAVANFAGALGFNRPVRQIPAPTFQSKADQRRAEARARKLRQIERERAKELKGTAKKEPKSPKLKAEVFKTKFEEDQDTSKSVRQAARKTFERLTDEEFHATDAPLARLVRD